MRRFINKLIGYVTVAGILLLAIKPVELVFQHKFDLIEVFKANTFFPGVIILALGIGLGWIRGIFDKRSPAQIRADALQDHIDDVESENARLRNRPPLAGYE